jgi:hypothetical protein
MNINQLIEKYKTYHANTKENLSKTLLTNSDDENKSYFDALITYSEIIRDLKSLVKEKAEVKTRRAYVKKVIKKDKPFKFNKDETYKCVNLTKTLKTMGFNLDSTYKCVANSDKYLELILHFPQGDKVATLRNTREFQLVQEFKNIKPNFKYKKNDRYLCIKEDDNLCITKDKIYVCLENSNNFLCVRTNGLIIKDFSNPETHFRKLDKNETIEEF